jgi:hypothetical protein
MSHQKQLRTASLIVGLLFLVAGLWLAKQPRYGYPWAPVDDTRPKTVCCIGLGLGLLCYSYFRK